MLGSSLAFLSWERLEASLDAVAGADEHPGLRSWLGDAATASRSRAEARDADPWFALAGAWSNRTATGGEEATTRSSAGADPSRDSPPQTPARPSVRPDWLEDPFADPFPTLGDTGPDAKAHHRWLEGDPAALAGALTAAGAVPPGTRSDAPETAVSGSFHAAAGSDLVALGSLSPPAGLTYAGALFSGAAHPGAVALPLPSNGSPGLAAASAPGNPGMTPPAASTAPSPVRLAQVPERSPLAFEPNRGQTDAQVRFLARAPGYTLFLTATEAVLVLPKPAPATPAPDPAAAGPTDDLPPQAPEMAQLRMQLVGANPAARVVGRQELPGVSNYFTGNDPHKWLTQVPHYAHVEYQDIYPGINLVYYGSSRNSRQLEYDWVVNPGADPGVVRLAYAGALDTRVDATGNLHLQTLAGEVVQHAPVAYQTGPAGPEAVDARFALDSRGQVRVDARDYDPSRPLIIDPVLSYSTYLGGSANENSQNRVVGGGIAVNAAGNAYVTGQTQSADFPTANPSQTYQGNGDVFVTKLDPLGQALVYSTYLGGSGDDVGKGLAVDSAGNAYVTGDTNSTNFPTVNAFQPTYQGRNTLYTRNAFVAKVSPSGAALLYSTYLGGSGGDDGFNLESGDRALAIAVDGTGKVYVAGNAMSHSAMSGDIPFPTTPGAFQPDNKGNSNAFVAKLDPTLAGANSLLYSTHLGGNWTDVARGIAVDNANPPNIYVTGYTSSDGSGGPIFPTTTGAFQTFHRGGSGDTDAPNRGWDAFITKLKPDGTLPPSQQLLYSTFLGGSPSGGIPPIRNGDDKGLAIAVDNTTPLPNIYVTGSTGSTNFPTSAGAFQTNFRGVCQGTPDLTCNDAFITKLKPDGTLPPAQQLLYSTYLGGTGHENTLSRITGVGGIAVDGSGNIFVTGVTGSSNFPLASSLQSYNGMFGSTEAFVAKLNPTLAGNASLVYSTYLGGSGGDSLGGDGGTAIALDADGTPYVTGYTESTDFPTTFGAFQTSNAGGRDAFVAKLSATSLQRLNDTASTWLDVGADQVAANTGALRARYPLDFRQTPASTLDDFAGFNLDAALVYTSDRVAVQPIGEVTPRFDPKLGLPDNPIRLDLFWNDSATPQVTTNFDPTGHNPGDTYLLAAQVPPPPTVPKINDTGLVPWRFHVHAHFSNPQPPLPPQDMDWDFSDRAQVVVTDNNDPMNPNSRDNSPIGPGWSLAALDRLVLVAGGVLLVYGDGSAGHYFAKNADGTFTSPPNDFGTLAQPMGPTTTYTYTSKNQVKWNFSYDPDPAKNGLLRTVEDSHKLAVTFTYQDDPGPGRLLRTIQMPDGGITTFTYMGGVLMSITEPGNRTLQLTHTGLDLTAITDVDGSSLRSFTYDPQHRLLTDQWDPWNLNYTYDPNAHVLRHVDQGLGTTYDLTPSNIQGLVTSPARSASQAVAPLTDALMHTTTYTVDVRGRQTKLEQPKPGSPALTETWQRDFAGQVRFFTDERNKVTTYTYRYQDGNGDLIEEDLPDLMNDDELFQYDTNFHEQTRFTDALMHATKASYDPQADDLVQTEDAVHDLTTYTYIQDAGTQRSTGLEQTMTDPLGHVTTYQYYPSTRLLQVTIDANLGRTTYTYDALGNPQSVQDPEGRLTTTSYDARRLLTQTEDARHGLTRLGYNAARLLTSRTDANGHVTSYQYDRRGLLTATVEAVATPAQRTTGQTYDAARRLTAAQDARGNSVTYAYDAADRRTGLTEAVGTPAQRATTMLLDDAGNLLSQTTGLASDATYQHRVTTSYAYDEINRRTLTVEAFGQPEQRSTTTVYDLAGNVTKVSDPRGLTASYAYDDANRRTQAIEAAGSTDQRTSQFAYDKASNLLSQTTGIGTSNPQPITTSYGYDVLNRRTLTIEAQGTAQERRTTTVLDKVGNALQVTDPRNLVSSMAYDSLNRRTLTIEAFGTADQRSSTMSYDAVGNLLGSTNPRGFMTQYAYDALNRRTLTTEAAGQPEQRTTTTGYDPGDNVTQVVNARGFTTQYAYDALNRRSLTTEAVGQPEQRQTQTVYDAADNVGSATDGRGFTTSYAYNSLNQRTGMTEAVGQPEQRRTTNTYDADSNLLTTVGPRGFTTSYAYDGLNRRTLTTEAVGQPEQRQIQTVYDAADNVLRTVNPRGFTTSSAYDALNRRTLTTEAVGQPEQRMTTSRYDADSNLTAVVDVRGFTTTSAYDNLNRRTGLTEAAGQPEQRGTVTTYDPGDNVLSVVNPRGFTTSYAYDALNHRTGMTEAVGRPEQRRTTTTYDPGDNVLTVVDARGFTTSYAYDALNRRTLTIEAAGQPEQRRTTTTYDANDSVLTASDPRGFVTQYGYDALNRRTLTTEAAGRPEQRQTTSAYDAASNLLATTDVRGFVSSYAYDALNRRTGMTEAVGQPEQRRTTTTYDPNDNVVTASDPRGFVTSYAYDALDRRTVTVAAFGQPEQQRSTVTYDAAGNVLTSTDGRGVITQYGYDALNRRTSMTEAAGPPEQRSTATTYDPGDNVLTVVNPRGVTTSYAYDALNRQTVTTEAVGRPEQRQTQRSYDPGDNLLTLVNPRGVTTSYAYDALNRRTGMTEAAGQPEQRRTTTSYDPSSNVVAVSNGRGVTTSYAYDALNRRTSTTDAAVVPDGLPPLGHPSPVSTLVYDAANNVVQRIDPRGKVTTTAYDALNRAVQTIDPRSGITTTVYDASNNVLSITDPATNRTVFAYDALNRRTSMTDPNNHSSTYAYDTGNLLTATTDRNGRRRDLTYDGLHRLRTETWTGGSTPDTRTYTYDAADNLLSAGNGPGAYALSYDALDRLTSAQQPFGVSQTFAYDATNNRTLAQDSLGGTTTSTYDALNRLQSRQFGGA
jgi:YD repeat-containing protein